MTAEIAAATAFLALLAVLGGTFAARLLTGASGGRTDGIDERE